MTLNLSADELLTTTRSVRKRLDFDRPVERAVVQRCIEIALQAPSGSNRQGWHWVLVDDADIRAALAAIYAANYAVYAQLPKPAYTADETDPRAARFAHVRSSSTYLAENFHRAPMLLVPCIESPRKELPPSASAGLWGSLLPAVWSFMLALRERGMGSAWTTIHLMNDGERQAAELLGIPYDSVLQGGLFPIAYTKGTDFRPAVRTPVESVLHWNNW